MFHSNIISYCGSLWSGNLQEAMVYICPMFGTPDDLILVQTYI